MDKWLTTADPSDTYECLDDDPPCRPAGWEVTSCITNSNECCMKITSVISVDNGLWTYIAGLSDDDPPQAVGGQINVTVNVKPASIIMEHDDPPTPSIITGNDLSVELPNDRDNQLGYPISCLVNDALPYPEEFIWEIDPADTLKMNDTLLDNPDPVPDITTELNTYSQVFTYYPQV